AAGGPAANRTAATRTAANRTAGRAACGCASRIEAARRRDASVGLGPGAVQLRLRAITAGRLPRRRGGAARLRPALSQRPARRQRAILARRDLLRAQGLPQPRVDLPPGLPPKSPEPPRRRQT